jgi:hypothetical protein
MGGESVHVQVRNASDEGIYDFNAWVRYDYSETAGAMGSLDVGFLKPGITDVWVDGVRFPAGGLAGNPHLEPTFRDSRGRRWQRLHTGDLGPDRFSPNAQIRPWIRWYQRRTLLKNSGGRGKAGEQPAQELQYP